MQPFEYNYHNVNNVTQPSTTPQPQDRLRIPRNGGPFKSLSRELSHGIEVSTVSRLVWLSWFLSYLTPCVALLVLILSLTLCISSESYLLSYLSPCVALLVLILSLTLCISPGSYLISHLVYLSWFLSYLSHCVSLLGLSPCVSLLILSLTLCGSPGSYLISHIVYLSWV